MPALPPPNDQIVITASRAPQAKLQSPASVTVIDAQRIERLGEPLVSTLLRLAPSAAVASTGPAGSLTEVRIRGAEANHPLLFVDGININDPASGDTPRYEILNADLASRIEVVRGPQSALWGSEAIGGVIAVDGVDESRNDRTASAEAGSFGFERASAFAAVQGGGGSLSAAFGFQRATGIDSFGSPGGDRDSYHNISGRLRATYQLGPVALGAAALTLTGRSEFDGYDPLTFEHTDTLDNSRNRLAAGRLWAELGDEHSDWSGRFGGSLLGSSNRNFLADDLANRTAGKRRTLDGQVQRRFSTGPVQHLLIVAGTAERESFHARGRIAGLPTDQDRDRTHDALTGEWRATAKGFTGDIAVRRDLFNRFKDATSLRASALLNVAHGLSLAGSYAEGIAQPTFFDLYGIFPNNFRGNPDLGPENSRGFEGSVRFRRAALEASVTAYRQRLHDEIIDIFDPVTFIQTTQNSSGTSRRWGFEAELGWQLGDRLRLAANYAYLDATQPPASGVGQVREIRRPKNSGSIALDGQRGRVSYGASISYAGSNLDPQEIYPYGIVRVSSYWLANARVAYAVSPGLELFFRGSNLFDARYEEVAGYRTEGIGGFLGLRLRAGPRSSR